MSLPHLRARSPIRRKSLIATALSWVLVSQMAFAQGVSVEGAWARATVPGQTATGAFMTLLSGQTLRLVSIATPVAGVAEVHEMRMEGDIMKMSALKGGLLLPAGQKVELKPGSLHLMLMDLKMPLSKNSRFPVTLLFVDTQGTEIKTEVSVPVGMVAPTGSTAPADAMHSGH